MSLDQEHFDKLESYVDGTLDAEGQAQMQKLLAENPQLQRMMTELIAQRQMLRNLPRAQAPEDLLESFQGQLEREALLGEPADHLEMPSRRVERWPHLVLAAAIVFLMLGLAGLIYEVLPRHRETIPLVFAPGTGVNVGPEAEPIEPATGPVGRTFFGAAAGQSSTVPAPSRKIAGYNSFDRLPSTQSENKTLAEETANAGRASPTDQNFGIDGEKLGTLATTSPSDGPVVVVVRSGSPTQAAGQVIKFLNSNNIPYGSFPASFENGQFQQQTAEAARAPIAAGPIQQNLRQQVANSDVVKQLPVTLPSQAATTANENGFTPQQQNGLADRNGAQFDSEAAPGQVTFRAMLTEQQLQRLNAQLLNQPNQWTEVRGEPTGRILSDALPPNAMQNAVVSAKAREYDKSEATTQFSINRAIAPTATPSPTTTESNFTFAARSGVATSQPIAIGGGIGGAFSGGAAAGLFATTQPTTQPTTATTAPSRLRTCLIIVNAQPVNFPTPAAEPTTLPATAPATQSAPATQP